MKKKLAGFFSVVILCLIVIAEILPGTTVSASTLQATSTSGVFYLPWTAGKTYPVSRAGLAHANAIDFTLPKGTPILAASSGKIMTIVQKNTKHGCSDAYYKYNNYIKIRNDKGEYVYYYHIATNSVPSNLYVGAYVQLGTLIAKSGNIGYTCPSTSGYHLHFEVRNSKNVKIFPKFSDVTGGYVKTGGKYKSGNLLLPALVTLNSPANGSNLTAGTVNFMWNVASRAQQYYMEYSGTSSGNSGWISTTNYSVALSAGTYTWRVKARNAHSAENSWGSTWTVTIETVSAPILTSPTDNSTNGPAFTFTWGGVTGATEYFIDYTGTASGNSGWISETTYPVNLSAGTYTWNVKARNAGSESPLSSTWTVNVSTEPPIPTLITPEDTAKVSPDVTLTWDSLSDATEYYAEYSGTSSGNSGWISAANYPVTALPVGVYTWHVKSRNVGGESPSWSSTWTFTVQSPPPAPALTSPADTATVDPGVTFTWDSLSDTTEYYVEYSGTSSGNSGWISGTSYPVTLSVGTYTWRVMARNAGGEGPWSSTWTFTVQPAIVPPPVVVLASPINNANLVGTSITFTWNIVETATEYYLGYSGTSSGYCDWSAATSCVVTLSPGTYTWQVKARNGGGDGPWNTSWTVNLQAPPALITINSPTAISPTGACSTSNWMTFTNNLGHTWYTTQNYKSANAWAPNPNYAYWKPTISIAGYYKIEAYIPSHGTLNWCGTGGKAISANTNDAHYQIYSSGAWRNVEKSQAVSGNTWINVGEFYLTTGNYNAVKLMDSNHQTNWTQLVLFSDIRIIWVRQ
jgi:murein DD-endopeptidase MepM/ murein hydrolase activator NlpD